MTTEKLSGLVHREMYEQVVEERDYLRAENERWRDGCEFIHATIGVRDLCFMCTRTRKHLERLIQGEEI